MDTQSTLEQVFEAEHNLKHARFALAQIEAEPRSTDAMRDGAYQSIANLVDTIAMLNAKWDAEVAEWKAEMAAAVSPAA